MPTTLPRAGEPPVTENDCAGLFAENEKNVVSFSNVTNIFKGSKTKEKNLSLWIGSHKNSNVISKVLEPSLAQVLLDDHAKDGSDTVC